MLHSLPSPMFICNFLDFKVFHLHWKLELEHCYPLFALEEPDVTTHELGDVLTAGQPQPNGHIGHLVDVLLLLQLPEGDKESILSIFFDSDASVNDLGLEYETGHILKGLETVDEDDDLPHELVILDGVLNDVKEDKLVLVPVQQNGGSEGRLPTEEHLDLF